MKFCTLNGVDDATSLDQLWSLSAQYPFVEWGVIYNPDEAGYGRYPSMKWINALCMRIQASDDPVRPNFALHISGKCVDDFLARRGDVSKVAESFGRIRVDLRDTNAELSVKATMFVVWPDKIIITAHNREDSHYAVLFMHKPRHVILFDNSFGRGVERNHWPEPLYRNMCGYTGGLSVDNISDQLQRIYSAAGGKPFWIEITQKCRGFDNLFDMRIAASLLAKVNAVMLSYGMSVPAPKVAPAIDDPFSAV